MTEQYIALDPTVEKAMTNEAPENKATQYTLTLEDIAGTVTREHLKQMHPDYIRENREDISARFDENELIQMAHDTNLSQMEYYIITYANELHAEKRAELRRAQQEREEKERIYKDAKAELEHYIERKTTYEKKLNSRKHRDSKRRLAAAEMREKRAELNRKIQTQHISMDEKFLVLDELNRVDAEYDRLNTPIKTKYLKEIPLALGKYALIFGAATLAIGSCAGLTSLIIGASISMPAVLLAAATASLLYRAFFQKPFEKTAYIGGQNIARARSGMGEGFNDFKRASAFAGRVGGTAAAMTPAVAIGTPLVFAFEKANHWIQPHITNLMDNDIVTSMLQNIEPLTTALGAGFNTVSAASTAFIAANAFPITLLAIGAVAVATFFYIVIDPKLDARANKRTLEFTEREKPSLPSDECIETLADYEEMRPILIEHGLISEHAYFAAQEDAEDTLATEAQSYDEEETAVEDDKLDVDVSVDVEVAAQQKPASAPQPPRL